VRLRYSRQVVLALEEIAEQPRLLAIVNTNIDHIVESPWAGVEYEFMIEEEGQLASMCKERSRGQGIALVYRVADDEIRFELLKRIAVL
jgi:hypothetical protein